MERRVLVVTSIGSGTSIKKELDALMTTIRACDMERSVLVVTDSIDIGMSIKKRFDVCQ